MRGLSWPVFDGRLETGHLRVSAMRGKHTGMVDDLNRLMAEETEASLRYFQMRFRLRGKSRLSAEKFFEDALRETMEHAEAIANQIRALGHIPRLQVNLSLDGTPLNAA